MPDDVLDPLLHQPVRLRIVSYLYRNRSAGFTELREALGLTAGNLQSHGDRLKAAGYIEIKRVLAGIFEVRWSITEKGEQAFVAYYDALKRLVDNLDPSQRQPPP